MFIGFLMSKRKTTFWLKQALFHTLFEAISCLITLKTTRRNWAAFAGFPTDHTAAASTWWESSHRHTPSSEAAIKKLPETNKNQRPTQKGHISNTVTQWRFSLTSDKITSISRMRSWLSHVKVDLGLKGSTRNDTACVSTQMSLAGLKRSPLVAALRTQALIGLTAGINGPVKLQTAFKCSGGSCCAGWSSAALLWAPAV